MKKKQPLPDIGTIRAAREAIKSELERRKMDEATIIVTGVPINENRGNWKAEPEQPRDRYVPPKSETPRAVAPKPSAPSKPKEWHYVWVQAVAPNERNNDPGRIIEGFYGVSDSVLFVRDAHERPVASQQLRPDDNPAAAARRLLRDRYRGQSAVPGFFDGPNFNPTRVFH